MLVVCAVWEGEEARIRTQRELRPRLPRPRRSRPAEIDGAQTLDKPQSLLQRGRVVAEPDDGLKHDGDDGTRGSGLR